MKLGILKILCILACLPFISFGQQDSTNTKHELNGGIYYQNKLHYFGRVDSPASSGLFPTLGFKLKNGLYAQGSVVFFQNETQSLKYAGSSIEAGYRFKETKHFAGNLFATKFLYNKQSKLVQSSLQAQTGINLAYNNKIANLNGGADLKFSDQTDIGLTAGLDHIFILKNSLKKSAFAFNPSVYVYTGTQNFIQTYSKENNVLGLPLNTQASETIKKLKILAYEFSAPIVFVYGKFNASVTPAYVIPQNLISTPEQPNLSERGKEMFYVTAGLGFRL
jgi:hypothetical protein